jgi:hypothetical protein
MDLARYARAYRWMGEPMGRFRFREDYEPRTPHFTHSHECEEEGCEARVQCAGRPVRDEDGGAECALEDVEMLCEDHLDMPTCDWCGRREPAEMVDHDDGRYHPACIAEMGA